MTLRNKVSETSAKHAFVGWYMEQPVDWDLGPVTRIDVEDDGNEIALWAFPKIISAAERMNRARTSEETAQNDMKSNLNVTHLSPKWQHSQKHAQDVLLSILL